MIKKILFILVLFFSVHTVLGQDKKGITIEFNNTQLKEALLKLESKTDYTFYFKESWLEGIVVNEHFENVILKDILTSILENTPINYLFKGNRIILTNNSIVYQTLPSDYFEEKVSDTTDENTGEETKAPIFKEEFIEENKTQKGTIITIGKQQSNNQNKTFEISGTIKNAKTGKALSSVSLSTTDGSRYAVTNENGFYTIKLPYGFNNLETNLLGFNKLYQNVIVYGSGTLNLTINENAETLDEVVIESKRDANIKDVTVGATKIEVEDIKTIPLVLGERDVLKVATTLPGIKTAGEGASGFNIRGGRADQNLILLDDAVIYNPSHFLGFFSAVNPFTTESLEIYKASIPAEYGGRLSSVFDIESKSGNTEKIAGEGSVGPVTANFALELPVIKNKTSIIAGVRATYSDYILRSLDEESLKNSEASFYDAIVKYTHDLNKNNSIEGTVYYSKDRFSITSDSVFDYSNRAISLKWNHTFDEKNRGELLFVNSQYKYNIEYDSGQNDDFNFGYVLNETQAKLNLNYNLNKTHKLSYGLSSKLYNIDPGTIEPLGSVSDIVPKTIQEERGLESAAYISDLIELNEKFSINAGLRYSFYAALGEATQNVYAKGEPKNESTVTEVKNYGNNEVIKTYGGLEYRVSGRYLLGNDYSIKAGYNRTIQYLHLLSTNTTMSPTDIWKLSDLNIEPQRANQYSLGLFKNILAENLEFSLEGYYKTMDDILDYKIGAQLILNEDLETELLQGEGKAYGVEFLMKKNKGRLNGYVGYSYSRSFIKLDSDLNEERVNNGDFFPANYDKPHDFSLVANYKITKRYSISTNFTYKTGRPVTYPIGRFYFAGEEQVLYSDRNQFRIPDYFRLDLGVNIEGNHKKNKLAHSFVNISVYNVLGRNNPYSVFFVNEDGKIKAFKTSIFSVPVPTITYNFKF